MKWRCSFEILLDSRKLGCIYIGSWDAKINLLFHIIIILLDSFHHETQRLSQKLLYFITKPSHLQLPIFSQIAQIWLTILSPIISSASLQSSKNCKEFKYFDFLNSYSTSCKISELWSQDEVTDGHTDRGCLQASYASKNQYI